ncbi:MAG TPA: hypothetical protein VJB56_00165 [Candidatus Paceibacterota bacterium]
MRYSRLLILSLLLFPHFALAAPYPNPINCDNFTDCVTPLVNKAGQVAIIIAVVMIVIGGFMMVTAFGDPGKLQRARATLLWAVIGLIVIIAAYALALAFKEIISGI